MKLYTNIGLALLGVWLIGKELLPLLSVNIPNSGTILTVMALSAGVLLLLGARSGHKTGGRNLGMLLLGIWLIATGLIPLLNVTFPVIGLVMATLAIAAGILILLRR